MVCEGDTISVGAPVSLYTSLENIEDIGLEYAKIKATGKVAASCSQDYRVSRLPSQLTGTLENIYKHSDMYYREENWQGNNPSRFLFHFTYFKDTLYKTLAENGVEIGKGLSIAEQDAIISEIITPEHDPNAFASIIYRVSNTEAFASDLSDLFKWYIELDVFLDVKVSANDITNDQRTNILSTMKSLIISFHKMFKSERNTGWSGNPLLWETYITGYKIIRELREEGINVGYGIDSFDDFDYNFHMKLSDMQEDYYSIPYLYNSPGGSLEIGRAHV